MTEQLPMPTPTPSDETSCGTSRRAFLGTAVATVATALTGCGKLSKEEFLQHHFKELSKDEVATIIARLEAEYKEKYHKTVKVGTEGPIPGVIFGYGLDLSRCIGCRRCVHACVKENNQSRSPEIQWIRVLQMDKEEGVNLEHAEQYYNPAEVPQEGHFYMPVQCQQCKKPPCIKVCPVGATWKEKDGIVVVDYNWCIGCRYCMAACPYGARHFNWGEPHLDAADVNPDTHYLGNRPRPKGVVEKCTFCIQRTRGKEQRYTACVEICPTGSRKFGNLLDPKSEIRQVLETKRVFKFKEDLNTQPTFFYFYGV